MAIVGGGIVGLAVARELALRHPGKTVCVLEREPRVAAHQSSHNSGVIHAGVYYEPGSLKARLCVEGARELYAYCERRAIEHKRCGKVIVAVEEAELGRLDELERRARANGVAGLRRLDGAASIERVEPHASGLAGLHSPSTGIVDFAAVARAYAEDLSEAGGVVVTSCEVLGVRESGRRLRLLYTAAQTTPIGQTGQTTGQIPRRTTTIDQTGQSKKADDRNANDEATGQGERNGAYNREVGDGQTNDAEACNAIEATHAVFCAGAWSDRLAVRAGASVDPRIVPFRGVYLRLQSGAARELVRALIYPVPDPRLPFLGVHLTRTIDGEALIGPTALLAGARDAYELTKVRGSDLFDTLAWPGTWRMAARFWRTGLSEIHRAAHHAALVDAAARYVPALSELAEDELQPALAGVRAQALGRDGRLIDDFVFARTPRALHVRNAPSPAATSSLAIARHVADEAGRMIGE